MSDPAASQPPPLEPLPEIAQPFDLEPRPVTGGRGCGKVALFGCGLLLLLFGIGAVTFLVKADDILVWMLGKLERQIEEQVPAADRARLEHAFDDFYRAVEEGEMDPVALQPLQRKLMELSRKAGQELSTEEVDELIAALERAAGRQPAETGRSPETPEPGAGAPPG